MKLDLETRTVGGVVVLCCRGRLTYRDEAAAFSETIAGLLSAQRPIIIDIGGLEAVDSAGLGELVVVHMWARASGCSLKVAGANDRIRHLLELTNLSSFLELHGTLDDALRSLPGQAVSPGSASHAA